MPQKTVKHSPMPDKYVDFLEHVSLEGVGLDDATMKVDRVALKHASSNNELEGVTLEAGFRVVALNERVLVTAGMFTLQQRSKQNEQPLLHIECTFSALFDLTKPIDRVTADRFASSEARLVFWPYLRHFIADSSYRMAINPILVPLMKNTGVPNSKSTQVTKRKSATQNLRPAKSAIRTLGATARKK